MLTSKRWELTFLPFFIQVILGFGSPVAWHTNDATPPETPIWSSGDLTKLGKPDRVGAKWAEGDGGAIKNEAGREGRGESRGEVGGEVKVMLAQSYQHEKLSYLWLSLSLHQGDKERPNRHCLGAHLQPGHGPNIQPLCACLRLMLNFSPLF